MNEDNPKVEAVKRWLDREASGNQLVAELLWLSVGRVLLSSDAANSAVVAETLNLAMEMPGHQDVQHIADWLKVAVADNAPWITRVDDLGRPKKLVKLNTMEAIVAEADKQMRRKQTGLGKSSAMVSGEEELHFDVGDGWSLVKLLSESALDRESRAMRHCIGHGSYDGHLHRSDALLLSLRDPSGKPHATIEIVDGKLIQFRGKQNLAPVEKYISKCLPYFSARKIRCQTGYLVTDVNGIVFSASNLPEILEVAGDAHLRNERDGTSLRLPREIRCGGRLTISGYRFSNVPEYVECASLRLAGDPMPNLPPSIIVAGEIDLGSSKISALPEGLHVRGHLKLVGTRITEIPSGLRVDGILSIPDTSLTELPADLRTGGIDMRRTSIARVDAAWLGGGDGMPKDLVASESGLEHIVGTPVFGILDISGSKVVNLPDGLQVRDLDISRTAISTVPADACITGKLTVSDCQDVSIEVVSVGGDVDLGYSRVSMTDTFECGGKFVVGWGMKGRMPTRLKAKTARFASPVGLPDVVEADTIDIFNAQIKAIHGTLKARELRVSPKFEFFGDGVEVAEVSVGDALWGSTALTLDEAKCAIALHGNLEKDHNGEPTTQPFHSFLTGLPSGGKTTIVSRLLAMEEVHLGGHREFMLDTETTPEVPASLLPRYGDFDTIERRQRRNAAAAHQAQRELHEVTVRRNYIYPFPLLRPIASRNDGRVPSTAFDNPPDWWTAIRADLERNMQTCVARPLLEGRPGQGKP
ncbi:PcfJ domain-containing protein [Rhizobium sp. BK176]|uniref:PcfJ domain-containing protein n=1 Tax=Rhizobium sp. BK176 TaxID=2587071 RepID=UPI00216A4099|nr:PcfJ domain-containing protein [Rhizobium sp. BK176]MCS4090239.1 hypothetical protein [Rhizobium sp. BK176]